MSSEYRTEDDDRPVHQTRFVFDVKQEIKQNLDRMFIRKNGGIGPERAEGNYRIQRRTSVRISVILDISNTVCQVFFLEQIMSCTTLSAVTVTNYSIEHFSAEQSATRTGYN